MAVTIPVDQKIGNESSGGGKIQVSHIFHIKKEIVLIYVLSYCVINFSNDRFIGKIYNSSDRQKIRTILNEIEVPKNMGVIVRTAGANKTKNDSSLLNFIHSTEKTL